MNVVTNAQRVPSSFQSENIDIYGESYRAFNRV